MTTAATYRRRYRAAKRAVSSLRWVPDPERPDSVDDLFAQNVDFRLEQMSATHYWCAIFVEGVQYDFDIFSKRRITVFPRQPAPRSKERAA